jgi:hypothetical protein
VNIPGLFFPAQFRSEWLGPAGHAMLFILCLLGCAWGWRRERGGFWPPFVFVALLLLLGVRFGA